MPINLVPPTQLQPIAGVRIGVAKAAIRYENRRDLVLFELQEGATSAAVFTNNAFCAAPVQVARQHMGAVSPRVWLVNTGSANAGTGQSGLQNATRSCELVAAALSIDASQVLPFSTGVIGEHLPMDRMAAGITAAAADLGDDQWLAAAEGIMTTDTVPKGLSVSFDLDGSPVTITGIVKGSGMIRPDMATMLGFIATDARIASDELQVMLQTAVQESFNSVTVDGDTSTNDACVIAATGASAVEINADNRAVFQAELNKLCIHLAESMIRDAEGATKLITVAVEQAVNVSEARDVAYTIAHSPLVKTAFFASDPNWGRILAAVGRSGVQNLDVSTVELMLEDAVIARHGAVADEYDEQVAQAIMDQAEIRLCVRLGRGDAQTTIKTCDLSHDYVRINAEYRS